jgi:bacterioferritin
MDEKKKQLIDGLNEDLANEYSAMIMYNHYAATVQGIAGQVLKEFFQSEVNDEIGHAQLLAEKIVALGGTPTVTPKPIKGATNVKEMLENTLQAEIETIERYTLRCRQAEEAGEIGLKIELEDLIADETKHKLEIERLLRDPLFK